MILPSESDERANFLHALARRSVPSFDFFLFSLLSGLILGIALLFDAPALFVLAALLAPFMAPIVGIALGAITGTGSFVVQSLGSLGIGSLIVFLCGSLAGWTAQLLPERLHPQAALYSQFSWPGFLVLALGAGLTMYLVVRSPNQKPLVTSVAIAYSLYLPIGTAGFGLVSGVQGLWPQGLILFLLYLVWAAILGALVLGLLGLRPLNSAGRLLGGAYLLAGLALIVYTFQSPLDVLSAASFFPDLSQQQTAWQQPVSTPSPAVATPEPSRTARSEPGTPTPTRSLVPSRTPTLTITPVPTPIWARITAIDSDGAMIRTEPGYEAAVLQSILNGTLVEVLPEVVDQEGVVWVHIRTTTGKEGWIVRSLLRTATPAAGW